MARGMTDITKAIATSFIRSTEAERGGKAADRRIRTLKALWNWHKDAVPRNPWRFVAKPAVEQYVKYVPTPDDISKVLAVAKPWQADLLNTLLLTGARVSEILNLTWEDVADQSLKLWTRKRKGGARQYRTLPIGSSLHVHIFNSIVINKNIVWKTIVDIKLRFVMTNNDNINVLKNTPVIR